jgi:hypothetical protein
MSVTVQVDKPIEECRQDEMLSSLEPQQTVVGQFLQGRMFAHPEAERQAETMFFLFYDRPWQKVL